MDWNDRYSDPGYLFGTRPAQALLDRGHLLPPGGRVLCVADGEGRNSAYLAQQGHAVCAFDPAPNAVAKARDLVRGMGVEVAYSVADIASWDWQADTFDAVVGIFIQFAAPADRARLFRDMATTLRPGGVLFLHGYAPRQVTYKTGGPPFSDNMYTLDLLADAFAGWEQVHAADYDAEISEGAAHVGRSALIDFVARKPGRSDVRG